MTKLQIKDLKRLVRKALKRDYPGFRRLKNKLKKQLLLQVLQHAVDNYDRTAPIEATNYELCGIDEIPSNIYTLDQMEELIDSHHTGMLELKLKNRTSAIKDPELQFINELCDWSFVNSLIAPESYSPAHRKKHPVHFFKAELLKALQYPEIAYRKFCDKKINKKDRRENRAFIGLKAQQTINHSELSKFRLGLSYDRLINVMVYFIHLFLKEKGLPKNVLYAVDSTELAEKISNYPLAKLKVGKDEIRLYRDIDADCGSRRKKRDKSNFVVGYRLHTLTVIDPERQIAYPLLSLLASANHHDSNFLVMLVELGKAIGLDLNIIIGDQAYGDEDENDDIQKEHNITILTQPKTIKKLPDFVDADTFQVHHNDMCDIPMTWRGVTHDRKHEYVCEASVNDCPLAGHCDKIRHIPVDSGAFGQIPYHIKKVQELCSMRKVAERPFNLLKHREGLEPLRTLSRETTRTVTVIANIATLLIEIAGYRRTAKVSKNEQLELFREAA
jgi:hypothetical protein